ncbi:hypothetical protein NKI56_26180 [Mesorhizobium sp. M0622]|uniref:hypothetical protein n=1 Tax=unclassified Mesorhizobium TaxID=325217 RepID=UPI00333778B7
MRTFHASCILVFAALVATPARAECQCLANGRTFHHGEFACLQLPSGPELAQCDMVLNISSWKKIQSGCPEATAPLSVLVEGGEQQSGEAGHKALTTTNTPT